MAGNDKKAFDFPSLYNKYNLAALSFKLTCNYLIHVHFKII